jgi:hypothetical protein
MHAMSELAELSLDRPGIDPTATTDALRPPMLRRLEV